MEQEGTLGSHPVARGAEPGLAGGAQADSGTAPGVPWDGLLLPLNPDVYFYYTLIGPNGPGLTGTLGTLSALGTATASLTIPAGLGPALAGTTLHHAYAVFVGGGAGGTPQLSFVSNAVPLLLLP